MIARRPRKSGVPLDQCDPPEMVEILLGRLKDCQLDEFKKSLLCVELNDLLWFFEKHPESVGMFRSDMLEWRGFLKQSKAYMDDMFETKMARTKQIMNHITGTGTSIQDRKTVKGTPQPSYYQILFRPGIRSVRQYPINVEHYGEQNANIDQLHKQIAKMREEIIFAPQTKMSRDEKTVLFDILLSIAEICAYDVLDGVGFLKEMRVLINSIVEGEEYRKKINIVNYMSSLTSKLKEHAKCHWMEGNAIKRKMWDDIARIERDLELKNKPNFDLELLSKSNFLRMEKIKEIVDVSTGKQAEYSAGTIEDASNEEQGPSLQEGASISESIFDPSSVFAVHKTLHEISPLQAQGCVGAVHKLDSSIYSGVAIVEVSKDDSIGCGLSSGNVCSSKGQLKCEPSNMKPTEDSASSPVIEWANNIEAKYGGVCRCNATEEDEVCGNDIVKYIPDAAFEEETIFKSKECTRPKYEVLKHVAIPPAPDDTDVATPLINIVRVELEDDQDEKDGDAPEELLNPYLGRRRLLRH